MEYGDKPIPLSYHSPPGNESGKKKNENGQFFQQTATMQVTMLLEKRMEEMLTRMSNQSSLNFLFFVGKNKRGGGGQEEIKMSETKQLLAGSMVHIFK